MKKYEVMYIINAAVEEEDRKNLIETLAKIITDEGGKVTFSLKPYECVIIEY